MKYEYSLKLSIIIINTLDHIITYVCWFAKQLYKYDIK